MSKNKLQEERRKYAQMRFYVWPDVNANRDQSVFKFLVCDRENASGKINVGKFKTEFMAEIFRQGLIQEYILHGELKTDEIKTS